MAKTYSQLLKDIEALTAEAQQRRAKEIKGVVARINEAMAFYGLTPADLALSSTPAKGGSKASVAKPAKAPKRAAAGKSDAAKFRDGAGNTWVGRGPRPQWLRDALQAGRSLSDFAVDGAAPAAASSAPAPKAAPGAKRKPGPAAKKAKAARPAAKKASAASKKRAGSTAPAADIAPQAEAA